MHVKRGYFMLQETGEREELAINALGKEQGKQVSMPKTMKKENSAFSPKMVRDLLKIDNETIIGLCKKISLVPKKNSKGQTYFSRDDVKILKRVQDLQAQAMEKAKTVSAVTSPIEPEAEVKAVPAVPQIQTVFDTKLAERAVDTIERLNSTLTVLEDRLSTKLNSILDEKLDGMDEVVVELIRAKTENENLRNKVNELNKENFYLKNNLSSYKSLGFGFYTKKQIDTDEI